MHLAAREKPEQRLVEAFHRDGQDALGEQQGRRALQRDVAGKGPDRSEPRIAATHRVVALGFEVSQEAKNQLRIDITQGQLGRRLAELALSIAQQEPEGVPVRGHGPGAHGLLLKEALGKETLDQGGKLGGVGKERDHVGSPWA